MPYSIDYWDDRRVLYVRLYGEITFDERCQYVAEGLQQFPSRGRHQLLIDVRECINKMTFDEQKRFAAYLNSRRELLGAKVAVLHKPAHNPNIVIDSYAVMGGCKRELFSDSESALNWLASGT